ncbi:PKD domain-containing protein [Hymenobacter tibetensis]|uniref:PKD domain-containing protein n=1 Tax=Hymenobacter tibetensis TaxID=497967 RepID=A0ABY4D1J1_9BACT|nr:PKD domain-containing protein [Hymenobacter tibetensis]UOG76401.1 PKD domain-containing protein [Hymenobacter tibetensis]
MKTPCPPPLSYRLCAPARNWRWRTTTCCLLVILGVSGLGPAAVAQEDRGYKVYQFPADKIPRIDGQTEDWASFPNEYVVGTDQLQDDSKRYPAPDPTNLDVHVKVAWVKGLNRLYFLYEAYDDYWDFSLPGLHNDTFEVVVDGDLSGGPLIAEQHPYPALPLYDRFKSFHGVQAQNYHIFTPAVGKDWALAWGSQPWIKRLPYANIAYSYQFKPGGAGKLVAEFWITPFDYAGAEGPARAIESVLTDNKKIGLTWAVIDYDDVQNEVKKGFWNLSRQHKMYGNSSLGTVFTLMPLAPAEQPRLQAQWSFRITDPTKRQVAFRDESQGTVTRWRWDFGDNTTSKEQNPVHTYREAGNYVVVLYATGPAGESRMSKVWEVVLP